MELAEIIKWVDKTNLYLELSEDGYESICRKSNDEKLFLCEYEKYVYSAASQIIQIDSNNRELFIRRLLRCSLPFFRMSSKVKNDDDLFAEIDDTIHDGNSYDLSFVLYTDLLMFYSELIRLCVECGLNTIDLCPYDDAGIINDIITDSEWGSMRKWVEKMPKNKKWQDYIIGQKKEKWEKLIIDELKANTTHNGKLIATIILALQKCNSISYTTKKAFYKALRVDFPQLNSDEAINKYLNVGSCNNIVTPISIEEIEQVVGKISC